MFSSARSARLETPGRADERPNSGEGLRGQRPAGVGVGTNCSRGVLSAKRPNREVSTWQSGEPKKSIWVGVKTSKKDQLEIASFRCDRCGYLEQYALKS
jgi:hypothetical protein